MLPASTWQLYEPLGPIKSSRSSTGTSYNPPPGTPFHQERHNVQWCPKDALHCNGCQLAQLEQDYQGHPQWTLDIVQCFQFLFLRRMYIEKGTQRYVKVKEHPVNIHVNLNVNMNAHGAIIGQDIWDGIAGMAGITGIADCSRWPGQRKMSTPMMMLIIQTISTTSATSSASASASALNFVSDIGDVDWR